MLKAFPFVLALLCFNTPLAAQYLDPSIEILDQVEVRRNEGCLATMKRTKYPLKPKQCTKLLAEMGRYERIDYRIYMPSLLMSAHVYPGERFVYVKTKNGSQGWVPVDMN